MGNLWKMGSVVQRVIVANHIENKGKVKKNRSNSPCLRAETHRQAFFHFPGLGSIQAVLHRGFPDLFAKVYQQRNVMFEKR